MAELRRHPVSGEWVVICPEKTEVIGSGGGGSCIYCPGNETQTGAEIYRVGGDGDPRKPGWSVRVVAESPPLFHVEGEFGKEAAGVCDRMEAIGAHEVVVESPSHETEFEDLNDRQVLTVLDVLRQRALDLARDSRLKQILIFKSHTYGERDGAAHPRWHIVSTPFVPAVIKEELKGSLRYFSYKERCVLCDYILQEMQARSRIICQNDQVIAVSPYAARFPYEVWVLPLRHSPDFQTIARAEMSSLGEVLKRLIRGLRKVPQSRGYVIAIHTAPFRRQKAGSWKTIDLDFHWHLQARPAVDMLNGLKASGGFHLNPVSPEDAAKTLSGLC